MAASVMTSHVLGPAKLISGAGGTEPAKLIIRTDPFAIWTDPRTIWTDPLAICANNCFGYPTVPKSLYRNDIDKATHIYFLFCHEISTRSSIMNYRCLQISRQSVRKRMLSSSWSSRAMHLSITTGVVSSIHHRQKPKLVQRRIDDA